MSSRTSIQLLRTPMILPVLTFNVEGSKKKVIRYKHSYLETVFSREEILSVHVATRCGIIETREQYVRTNNGFTRKSCTTIVHRGKKK